MRAYLDPVRKTFSNGVYLEGFKSKRKKFMWSMTGFGSGNQSVSGSTITTQITSVNRKQTDIRIKLPTELLYLEIEIRNRIASKISRGGLQVRIELQPSANFSDLLSIDNELVDRLSTLMVDLSNKLNLDNQVTLGDLFQIPNINIITTDKLPIEKLELGVLQSLGEAIDHLIDAKIEEGKKLGTDIRKRHKILLGYVNDIESNISEIIKVAEKKLHERIGKIVNDLEIDDERLVKEIAFLTDRCDVSEEITRLLSHLESIEAQFSVNDPVGRKLDFLIQECFREINTLGAKCNHIETSKIVIDFKTELERIREQVQNIE